MKKIIVTTSWDDGHQCDIRLANLLKKYSIKGTFYISPKDRELAVKDRLTDAQIVDLGQDFEIGAHTMTHPRLTQVDDKTARQEIVGSKEYLENILHKPVTSFCYPGGQYTKVHAQIAREAGFKLARTVKRFATILANDPFALPTTIHAYRHWSDALPILRAVGIRRFFRCYLNWDDLAIVLFERARTEGGVFHLWGHSWEIEKNDDWDRLERVFDYIVQDPNIQYLTNSELI